MDALGDPTVLTVLTLHASGHQIERTLAGAPADVANRVKWAPIGEQTTIIT